MHPTDENQAGSTRPNLMSSRRAVGEDNILAMLERDSARRSGGRASNLRLAWYGAAAAFAGILAGGVAWLAYDNYKSAAPLPTEYEASLAAAPPVLADAGAPAQPAGPMLPVPAGELPRAAVIVDEAPPPARSAPGTLPPLVMLPKQKAGAARAPAPPAARPAAKDTLAPSATPPRQEAAPARPAARPAPKDAPGAAPAKARAAESAERGERIPEKVERTDKAKAAGARGNRPAAARVAASLASKPASKPAAKPAPKTAAKTPADAARQRKAAGAAPQVDSDVALISAIISQSERHRGEREAAACKGAACPPKAQP